MKKKYSVVLSRTKTVIVSAEDEDDAKEIAEAKANKTRNLWVAEMVSENESTIHSQNNQ